MFRSIGRSITLLKVCLRVLAADKELMLFPVFSAAGVVVLVLAFLGIWVGIGAADNIEDGSIGGVDILLAAVVYFLATFVVIFFNSALVYAAHERLTGGDPTVRSGLKGAWDRVGTIFVWAVVAGTVGLVLHAVSALLRQRGGIVGQIVGWMLKGSWTVITFFVVPLIVIEGRPIGSAFGSSFSMLRRTWGEQATGRFGLGIAGLLALLVVAGIFVLLLTALSPLGAAGTIIAVSIGAVLGALVAAAFAALEGIYKAALYQYAATGQVPALFPTEVIQGAFQQSR